jgi:hypothetical protein
VNTGLDTIVGATWNGYALTAQDAADAISVNLNAGHVIFWVKAEDLKSSPKTVTIAKEGYESATFTVSFTDTHTGD